ncbi:MAG: xanthine dehydrogenase family protein molybdopterin-binding subunit [Nitrososphaerota archaeon]|nr:xanthine dehydrogenase family protein molybdopterin-binding subunit [Nitrososphaerota archaeon]
MSSSSELEPTAPPFNLIGNPNVVNRDILARVTGARKYTSDIHAADIGASNMVYMGLIYAPYPSAKVTSIDVSKAKAAGYYTLTADDLPPYDYYAGGRSWIPLVSDSVMFAGQPIVAVGADTPNHVTDALNLVSVQYEAQPYVFDIEQALQPNAIQLWPGGNSLLPAPEVSAVGDINIGFSQADVILPTTRFDAGFHQHMNMEPVNCTAWWNNGTLYVWSQENYTWSQVSTLASYFQIPASDVVCRMGLGGDTNSPQGTNLGNGISMDYDILAAIMSRNVGAPVQYVPTRPGTVLASTARFPVRSYVKLGATNAGLLTAMQVTQYMDFGARGGAFVDGNDDFYEAYVCPNFSITAYAGNTNSYGHGAPMRDVGESQAHFAMEVAIDMLAEMVGMDPVAFRLKNIRSDTNQPNDPITNAPASNLGEPDTLNMAVNAFNWSAKWQGWGVPSSTSGTTRNGVGVAYMSCNKGSAFPPSTAQIQINTDGSVEIFQARDDHGAGTNTAVPMIACEALGLTSFDNVTCYFSDTSLTTDSSVTAHSQGTVNGGTALLDAVQQLKNQWFPAVAGALAPGTQATNLNFGNNTIYDTTNPSNSISFKAAAALLKQPLNVAGNGTPYIMASFGKLMRVTGLKIAEVQVDTETADVHVVNSVSSINLGRIIWYKGAYAQNEGGYIGMGIGQALYEEHVTDPTTGFVQSGSYLSPTFLDEKIPTIMETPDTHTPLFNATIDPMGPYGAKGIGEPALTTTSAAIANALSNALGGYRFYKLPIRRENIVEALEWMQSQGKL